MIKIFLALNIFIVSCGNFEDGYCDYRIEKFVKQFESYYGKKIDGELAIYFEQSLADSSIGEVVGICKPHINNKEIQIKFDAWMNFNDKRKELLIFHELGHCQLNRDHLNTTFEITIEDGMKITCPTSIMYPMLMSDLQIKYCYDKMHDYYINELFEMEQK